MKKIVLLIPIFLLSLTFSLAYSPPIYIANPETRECKYYFAGDAKHFNPRPENFTINIGYTTDFENQEQACNIYKCVDSKGVWNKEKNACICQNSIWDKDKGCIKKPNFLTGFIVFIKNLLKFPQ